MSNSTTGVSGRYFEWHIRRLCGCTRRNPLFVVKTLEISFACKRTANEYFVSSVAKNYVGEKVFAKNSALIYDNTVNHQSSTSSKFLQPNRR